MRRGIGRLRAGGNFNPIPGLFAAGEQGGWYDPSDFSTMFQDSAGTTPVTATTQPVGLILDKRLGASPGPEVVVNGDFSVDASWAKSAGCTIAGGVAVMAATANNTGFTQGAISAGKWYKISFTAVTLSAGGLKVNIGSTLTAQLLAAPGTYTGYVYSGASAGDIELLANGATTATIDNFSVKLVDGNHLIQATTTSRPTVQQDGSGFYYLNFDGVDDGLATAASVDFSSSDKLALFAGLTKSSDAAVGLVCELSADYNVNIGSAYLVAPNGAAAATFEVSSRGNAGTAPQQAATASGLAAPISRVVSGTNDIAGSLSVIRVNSVQSGTGTASKGTGNFGNYPLYVGRRGGSTLPFTGRIYQLVVRGAACTADQLTNAERYVGAKMGIAL